MRGQVVAPQKVAVIALPTWKSCAVSRHPVKELTRRIGRRERATLLGRHGKS